MASPESSVSSSPQWSKKDLDNAMLYGVLWELVRPCGHTEGDIDRVLEEDDLGI